MTLWSVFNICGHVYSKKKCNFILVLIKLVSDESDKIQRRYSDQKCVLPAGENRRHRASQGVTGRHRASPGVTGRHRASPGVTGRHRASPGDHVKKRQEFFFAWTRKVLTSLDQRNLVCLNRINDN